MNTVGKSVWNDVSLPKFEKLVGNAKTDVLIIGGGVAGILAAYALDRAGANYMLVEKDRICSGTTQNTTAKLTYQHGLIYQSIIKSRGADIAKKYLEANRRALNRYAEFCLDIDCDFTRRDNYVYSQKDRKKLEREASTLRSLGVPAEICESVPLPLKTVGAVKVPDQAQFHPLKFMAKISNGLNIYENTFVKKVDGDAAFTETGKIRAENIVVCTHFPFINRHGLYFMKMYQHRSYMLALENTPDVGGMYVDDDHGGFTFRNYGRYLIFGGAGARTGHNCSGWDELRAFAENNFPHAQERFFWAAQDCVSIDGMPYIGNYSSATSRLYVISGFNKWGLTGAMAAAEIVCDAILGKKNEFADAFYPSRSIIKPGLFANGLNFAVDILKISKKRCPHLGCAMKYNAAEHSWDCPCHGSRFARDGRILDNPANTDMK